MFAASILQLSVPSKRCESRRPFSTKRMNSCVSPPSSTPASPESRTESRQVSQNVAHRNPLCIPSKISSRVTLTMFRRPSVSSWPRSRCSIVSTVCNQSIFGYMNSDTVGSGREQTDCRFSVWLTFLAVHDYNFFLNSIIL